MKSTKCRFSAIVAGALLCGQILAVETPNAPTPGPWARARAWAWYRQHPWLVGHNFLASTAVNDVEMWQKDSFDPKTVDRELGGAHDLGNEEMQKRIIEPSDVLSFHNYGPLPGVRAEVGRLLARGRPVVCTEWMARGAGSRFETHLPFFKENRIACWNWGLVAGRTQTFFPWDSPKGAPEPTLWHHDILRTDGTPFNARETQVIKAATGQHLDLPRTAEARTAEARRAEANQVVEVALTSERTYDNPFSMVQLDAIVTQPDGKQFRIPGFWAGGDRWCFRYASSQLGRIAWRTECSDSANAKLHGVQGTIQVMASSSGNPLYRHGPIRVAMDRRHFEHADGTPFFWLGDTWWKGLCKRLTWEGFQELTADRKAKGFSVVQIVCGVYPDEGLFEPRWENEGGKPYVTRDFSVVNPAYFEYADRRVKHLVEAGIVPAIVGGWGRGDCDGMRMAGVAGIKRHWRNLIARFGAYPAVWIVGGESGGAQWTEVARYVRQTDPYHRPATIHPFHSARQSVTEEAVIDFDMLQTGHGDWETARGAIPQLQAAYARTPVMPAMIGECCYEGHMQTAFQDVQRYVFWGSTLSGSAGYTYGAAGIWHAGVEGDPGISPIYDWTTWKEGMHYPGSTQLGLGKRLLELYPWARFQPHPEWVEAGCFAAGIPGEVRFIYLPRRGVYNWSGPTVKQLERGIAYHAFYFNPTNGKRYDLGTLASAGPPAKPFEGHAHPLLFEDRFAAIGAAAWKDYGTPTERKNGRLIGSKGMVTILEKVDETDLMASAKAKSDAEAGIILRFHDADNYLVALYSPLFKSIFLHDRKNGQWGANLGEIPVPEIGLEIHLTAAVCGKYAAFVLTDGKKTYYTPMVEVSNITSGKAGLWLYQIGDHQEFGNFELSRAHFGPRKNENEDSPQHVIWSDQFQAPPLPSPQDWILVLERVVTVHGDCPGPAFGWCPRGGDNVALENRLCHRKNGTVPLNPPVLFPERA